MLLFIKHIDIEGPETIGLFFEEHGYEINTINLQDGELLPSDLSSIQAVVSLGGPMNVYEEDKFSFLKQENVFIQEIVKREIPFLGICLGSQLLAKACEGRVVKSPRKEIGFSNITRTQIDQPDPLFNHLDNQFCVYQWHEDMSELPPEAKLLAYSDACPHQAFKIGKCAYGLQFHVEITDRSIVEWSDRYFEDEVIRQQEKQIMLADYARLKVDFNHNAELMYQNFLNIVRTTKANN